MIRRLPVLLSLGCGSDDPHTCCPSTALRLDWCTDELALYKASPECHETVKVLGVGYNSYDCPAGTVAEVTPASAAATGFNADSEVGFAVRCKCP